MVVISIMAEEEKVELEAPSLAVELEEIKRELEKMSKEKLIDELAVYRLVIPKLGPFVKWVLENFYKPVYVRFRMGRETVGFLVGCMLVPDTLQLLAQEEVKEYRTDETGRTKTYVKYELRIVNAPVKELSFYDVIIDETDWQERKGYY